MSLKISRLEQILNFIGPLCKAVKKCLDMVYIGALLPETFLSKAKPFHLAPVVNVLAFYSDNHSSILDKGGLEKHEI